MAVLPRAGFPKAYLAGLLAVLTGAAVLAGCGTDSTSSGGGGGGESQTITIWEGYTEAEAKAFSHLVAEYEAQHPGQKVSPLFVNNDNTLQKVLTAVRGGSPSRATSSRASRTAATAGPCSPSGISRVRHGPAPPRP